MPDGQTVVAMRSVPREPDTPEAVIDYKNTGWEIFRILNESVDWKDSIAGVIATLKSQLDFDAVGIRFEEGEDFPYFAQEGFSEGFLVTENTLLARSPDGGICRNPDGSVCLECTCGLVISGKTDPTNPLFTKGGSSWTNNSFPFLQVPANEDPRFHPRNRCIHERYASVALVPIRSRGRIVGLLQLNDRRLGRFSLEIIEVLESIASQVGTALTRMRAEAELQHSRDVLEQRVADRTETLQRTNKELRAEIAERKRAEAALLASEERYRTLFTSLNQGFVLGEMICDPSGKPIDWRTLECNQAMERLTGVPNDVRLRKTAREIAPAMESFWVDEFGKVALTGQPIAFERFGTVTKKYWRMVVFSPAKGRFGALYQDITDRMVAEAEKEKLAAQNRQLQKSESLSRMAAAVAHHFNNQLQGVMLSLDGIAQDQPTNASVQEGLACAMQSARQAAKVSTLMLTYLGQSHCKHEPLGLSELCGSSTPQLRALLPRHVGFTVDTLARGPSISGNRDQIFQSLSNLVTNAGEACGASAGTVCLRVKQVAAASLPIAQRFPVDFVPHASHYACIEVEDTGGGIPAESIEKLFDPYFTSKFTGRGMGLPVVLGIVRAHDGVVAVETEVGRGSTFRLFLPM